MAINKELGLFLKTPLNKPIGYYIVLCMISTFIGAIFERVDLKTGFLYVLKYFEYIIVYFMVVNHLKDRKQAQSYVAAMLLTCAIVSVIGIVQIPGGERISAPFEGKVGEPNTFGGYLVFMICIVMGLLQASNSFRNQLIYGFLLLLYAIPLFYTQSRSSYLAAIPAVLSFVWLSKKKQWIFPLVLLMGLALPYITPRLAKERVAYTFTQGVNRKDSVELFGVKLDTSSSARLLGWQEAARDWLKHPVLGFGVTGYRFVDAQYIRTISETGFLGFFFFVLLLLTIFKNARRAIADTDDHFHHGLAMGFLAGFIGLIFHAIGANTFIIVRIMEPFWFLAGIVMTLEGIKRAPVTKKGLELPGHPRQQGQLLKGSGG
jgi:O-antigen ligase